jgi:ribosomal protein S12 methylthiotransferase
LLWEARAAGQAPEIDGVCYIGDPGPADLAPGQIRRMRVTHAHDYDLVGDLVDTPAHAAAVPAQALASNPFRILSQPLVPAHADAKLPHR